MSTRTSNILHLFHTWCGLTDFEVGVVWQILKFVILTAMQLRLMLYKLFVVVIYPKQISGDDVDKGKSNADIAHNVDNRKYNADIAHILTQLNLPI